MRSYRFSMEDILNLREIKEQDVMENMSQIQTSLDKQKEDLDNLQSEINEANKTSYKTIQELRYQNSYKSNLKEKVMEQNELIYHTKEELEKSRQELIEAQKERKIMEKLKEDDKKEYEEEVRKIEQNELDEIAVLRYNSAIM